VLFRSIGQAGPQGPVYRQDGAMWNGAYWSENVSELNTSLLSLELFFSLFVWMYIGILALLVLFVIWRVYRRRKEGRLIMPYLGLLDFKTNKMRAASNALALIALVIGVIAAFLPYYAVSLSIDSPYLTTEGWQDVLVIDGMNGLRVNTLDPEVGLVQLTALPIPLSILLITPLIFLLLGTIGVSDAKIARKYLTRGIVMLLPVLIIIGIIATLSSLYVYFPDEVTGVDDAKTVFDAVSASPFAGSEDVYLPESGETAQVQWGLGIGAYMLIATSALLLIAAVLRFRSKEQSYPFEKTVKIGQKWEDIPDVK
jgi:TM2 domain-containing membrane protein YozV